MFARLRGTTPFGKGFSAGVMYGAGTGILVRGNARAMMSARRRRGGAPVVLSRMSMSRFLTGTALALSGVNRFNVDKQKSTKSTMQQSAGFVVGGLASLPIAALGPGGIRNVVRVVTRSVRPKMWSASAKMRSVLKRTFAPTYTPAARMRNMRVWMAKTQPVLKLLT